MLGRLNHVAIAVKDAVQAAKLYLTGALQAADQLQIGQGHGPGHHFHARMFAPHLGIGEDPATGSAAAAFTRAFVDFEHPKDGRHRIVIEQGYAMGRPSQITLEMDVKGGVLTAARIGGSAVIVSEGQLRI